MLVSGLPLLYDVQALQVLEGALLSLFEEYAPEAVNVGKYSTYVLIGDLCLWKMIDGTYTNAIRNNFLFTAIDGILLLLKMKTSITDHC